VGRKTASVDQAGKRTEWSYDCQGRLTEVRQYLNGVPLRTNYTYDAVGNMLTQKDAENKTTTYTYDNMGRRKTRRLPGNQTEFYNAYDATGNLTSKTTFKGESLSYSYHTQTDRLLSESGPGFSHSFEYDGFLRRAVMNDASGATTFNYDERDRLTAKRSPFGTINYSYDPQGNLTRMITDHTDGAAVTYQYDALNRAVTCIDQHRLLNLTTSYSYDPVGNLANVNLPNGIAVTYVYDQLNRLTDMTSKLGSVTVTNYHYTLGNAGNRTHVTEFSGREVNWTYDDLYRLTGQTVSNDPGGITGGVVWTYDNVGNRLTQNSLLSGVTTQDFTGDFDLNDRLTEARTYDNNGSTLTDPSATYTYDALNRLLTASAGTTTISYKYDGDNNRVQKVINFGASAVTTRYLVDGNNLTGYAQVVEELDGTITVQRVYTYGHDLISQDVLMASSTWSPSYYLYDGQGSVRALTDGTGTVTDTYDYSAFGELLRETHPLGPATSNNYRFQGEQLDPDTGLYYLRARYMNPAIGRFQTMDGFEGLREEPKTLHKYVVFSNDPIGQIDPSGYFSLPEISITVAIAGILSTFPQVSYGGTDNSLSFEEQPKAQIQKQLIPVMYLEARGQGSIIDDEASNIGLTFMNRAIYAKAYPDACGRQLNFGNGTVFDAIRRGSEPFYRHNQGQQFYNGLDLKSNTELEGIKMLLNIVERRAWNACVRVSKQLPAVLSTTPIDGLNLKVGNRASVYFVAPGTKVSYERTELLGSAGNTEFYSFEKGLFEKKFR